MDYLGQMEMDYIFEMSGNHIFRVDLYNIDGIIYFGELTFYDGSGYKGYSPDDFDFILTTTKLFFQQQTLCFVVVLRGSKVMMMCEFVQFAA